MAQSFQFSLLGLLCLTAFVATALASIRNELVLAIVVPLPLAFISTAGILLFVLALFRDSMSAIIDRTLSPIRPWFALPMLLVYIPLISLPFLILWSPPGLKTEAARVTWWWLSIGGLSAGILFAGYVACSREFWSPPDEDNP